MANELKKNINSCPPMILKLYAHGLRLLFDWNWASTDFFEEIRSQIKKGKTILKEPIKFGVAYLLGKLVYEEYLLDTNDTLYVGKLKNEKLVFYLEDIIDYLEFHGADINIKPINEFHNFIIEINKLYNDAEKEYYNKIQNKQRWLRAIYRKILSKYRTLIFKPLLENYAKVMAERIIHDRELCGHISNILVTIGFDGNSDLNMPPKKWIKRKPTPKWVKDSLLYREGNRCAKCKCNLEKQKPTLDHIVPLSKGGTNDIINLQFLCYSCNQEKSNSNIIVTKSIPSYLDRNIRK